MSFKNSRIAAVFSLLLALMMGLVFRLASLSTGASLKPVSASHGSFTLEMINDRAYIYDCRFIPLTNSTPRYSAAVLPLPDNLPLLEQYYPSSDLSRLLADRKPILLPIDTADTDLRGVQVYRGKNRYSENQPAVHVIGSLGDGMTVGESGIEKALDQYLTQNSTVIKARYRADALGRAFDDGAPETLTLNPDNPAGAVLTIDLRLQNIAENALKKLNCGAVVIMDVRSGDLKAVASYPEFDPNDLSASLDAELSPFLNRAFSAYSVGSTFKLVTAAAALESGIPVTFEHTCCGSITVGDVKFNCQYLSGHGSLEMERALAVSCNPYFISLGSEVGGDKIAELASLIGFGCADTLWENYSTAPGNLPSNRTLALPAGTANFAFGQGELLATPLQICKLICVIANGGFTVAPRLIDGFTEDGITLCDTAPRYSPNRVISAETAETLRQYMINAVENGSGRNAAPEHLGAGGKTASAQTGQYIDGDEKIEGWFAGFYPADEPQFAIVVLAEGAGSGAVAAAPVFKEIADGIYSAFYADR